MTNEQRIGAIKELAKGLDYEGFATLEQWALDGMWQMWPEDEDTTDAISHPHGFAFYDSLEIGNSK